MHVRDAGPHRGRDSWSEHPSAFWGLRREWRRRQQGEAAEEAVPGGVNPRGQAAGQNDESRSPARRPRA